MTSQSSLARYLRALRHFAYLERPEGLEMEDAEGFADGGEH